MARRFVKELGDHDSVDEIYLASDKQLRSNRQGNLYLQVELSDKTGSINARMWNATETSARTFDNGDYVRVQGSTQLFQGALQLIAQKIAVADPSEIVEEDFQMLSDGDMVRLASRLAELLRTITNPHLAALAESYLADQQFMLKFAAAPAGVKHHHAYRGGLLEHVFNLMEIITRIADCYPQLDRDQLMFGAFLHDSGKIDELSYDRDFAYTDEGQLLGHIVLAIGMLDRRIAEVNERAGDEIPTELVLRLKHLIASHHGTKEHGSPTVPMTLEAVALHYLDNLDAKINHFTQLLRDDANVDSAWTQYHHRIERKLFKGSGSLNA